jgi:mannose-1-phosphate guanylyltransferase/mannose-6-phosphate isomerase
MGLAPPRPNHDLTITPVILCGGTGTRLWTLSRATCPKQYWALAGSGEEILLQQTHQRLEGIGDLQPGGDPPGAHGPNTAPAVAVAGLQSTAHGDDPLLLVLAADHVIQNAAGFRTAVVAAQLVTFGIVPTGAFRQHLSQDLVRL